MNEQEKTEKDYGKDSLRAHQLRDTINTPGWEVVKEEFSYVAEELNKVTNYKTFEEFQGARMAMKALEKVWQRFDAVMEKGNFADEMLKVDKKKKKNHSEVSY